MRQPAGEPAWRVVERGSHAQVWELAERLVHGVSGQERVRVRRFVELASGLNYLDEKGQWQPTREVFEARADGSFVARQGPLAVVVGSNVAGWVVAVRAAQGLALRAGPVAEASGGPSQ